LGARNKAVGLCISGKLFDVLSRNRRRIYVTAWSTPIPVGALGCRPERVISGVCTSTGYSSPGSYDLGYNLRRVISEGYLRHSMKNEWNFSQYFCTTFSTVIDEVFVCINCTDFMNLCLSTKKRQKLKYRVLQVNNEH